MPIDIATISNVGDGVTVNVTTNGVPSGTLSFQASRTPEFNVIHTIPYTGSNPYVLTMPAPVGWYVRALDNSGYGSSMCVWCIQNNYDDLAAIQLALQDIILKNAQLIESGLSPLYPNMTLKSVVVNAYNIQSYPSIIIDSAAWSSRYAFFPYGMENTFSTRIHCLMRNSDENISIIQSSQMGRIVSRILNQPSYETITLSNGLVVNYCYCSEGANGSSVFEDRNGFVGVTTLIWKCLALIQDDIL